MNTKLNGLNKVQLINVDCFFVPCVKALFCRFLEQPSRYQRNAVVTEDIVYVFVLS